MSWLLRALPLLCGPALLICLLLASRGGSSRPHGSASGEQELLGSPVLCPKSACDDCISLPRDGSRGDCLATYFEGVITAAASAKNAKKGNSTTNPIGTRALLCRAHRMLATVATTVATLSIQVLGLATTTTPAVCAHAPHARQATRNALARCATHATCAGRVRVIRRAWLWVATV